MAFKTTEETAMKRLLAILIMLLLIPTSVACMPGVKRWRLVWDPNTESDLAGYKVYYRIGSEAHLDANSLDVGNVTECPLDSLPLIDGVEYFFALTAYDTSQNESEFSVEVSHINDQTAPASTTLRLEEM